MYFILLTYLFCNWKSVSLKLPNLFHLLQSLPLWQPPALFSVLMSVSVLLIVHLFFRCHISVKSFRIHFSLSDLHYLAEYTLDPCKLSQMAKFHYFLCLSNITLCLYMYTYHIFFIHLSIDGHFEEGNGNPLQYSCLENAHRQRSLVGYSPWGHEASDTTE